MNGYQRITSALKGEKPDKTPIMLHNFMMVAEEYGVSMNQYRNDSKVISQTFISAVEKYKYDGIIVDIDTVTFALMSSLQKQNILSQSASCATSTIHICQCLL